MAAQGPDALRAALERLTSEFASARRVADAGLGPVADLPVVFARHPGAVGPEAAELVRELADAEPTRPLAAWAVALRGRAAGAAAESRARAWRAAAVVRTPGGAVVPLAEVDGALAAAGDRGSRLALDAARAALAGTEYAPLVRERFARERDAVEALGIADGYLATWERLAGVDARALAAGCAAFTRDTQGVWDDVLAEVGRRRVGAVPRDLPGGLQRGDVPALLTEPEIDALLPAGAALAAVRTQLAAMALDPAAAGRVRYDVGARPGQRPGAWCAAVRVPGEVYVTARPRAGVGAWRALLAAVGSALHAAHVDPDLPAELRYAGDQAVRAGIGALLAGLVADEGWLRRAAGLDRTRAGVVRRAAGFAALHALRRDAADCRLAVAVLGGEVPDAEAGDAGVVLLAEATGARVAPADVVGYARPWLGVATRVRGALVGAALAEGLRERFDEDWWRNPRAGPWLATEVLAVGGGERAEAVAARTAGGELATPGFADAARAAEAALV